MLQERLQGACRSASEGLLILCAWFGLIRAGFWIQIGRIHYPNLTLPP